MTDYEIRPMTAEDRAEAVPWAVAEGWGPGLNDMRSFIRVDEQGFWGGYLNGRMIGSISIVNYDDVFSFLGFYIVHPEFRRQGYGLKLWERAIQHAGSRVIGLDGVVDQQDNYKKSGFALAYRNIRYGGPVGVLPAVDPALTITEIDAVSDAVRALDARVFPAARDAFWQEWIGTEGHRTVVATDAGTPVGFATIRPCQGGLKLSPVVATSASAARSILATLLQGVPDGTEVFMDVPEPNKAAVSLAENLGFAPSFETARMYRGSAPALDTSHVFGVTTFELG